MYFSVNLIIKCLKTQNNVLGREQQTKKKTFYLGNSVIVLTLDMSFDAAANNNCLLQLNVPTRDRAECRAEASTLG